MLLWNTKKRSWITRIGGWGFESNWEIVFVSFVRACERAGEARRSCVRARGDVASVAGFTDRELCSGGGVPSPPAENNFLLFGT